MKALKVSHRSGEYQVFIGANLLDDRLLPDIVGARPVVIVTDENVARAWLNVLLERLPSAATLILPAGESSKSLETVSGIWTFLAEHECGRDAVLIALGGGVVGDMTGFAAACWMRGVDFIQVPTTLLAQVDASVGGKTAVDLPAGKNLIGAFHQPLAVFSDLRTLQTLPDRDFCAGFAEIIKAALISDTDFLGWLEANVVPLRERKTQALEFAIHRSCEIKAGIVAADEREQGSRALLNLGHTFGHALETTTSYRQFLHGEAVAVGLVLAAALSEIHCGLDPSLRPRLEGLLAAFGLPVHLPRGLDHDALLHAIRLDKKHTRSRWRLVLLEAPGRAVIREFSDDDGIRKALTAAAI